MSKTIGRNTNTTDEATVSNAVTLNTLTSVTVANVNASRIVFIISNPGNLDIWVKLQAASVDNDIKGILVPKKTRWEMPTDNIYTGEISAIAPIDNPEVYITEY